MRYSVRTAGRSHRGFLVGAVVVLATMGLLAGAAGAATPAWKASSEAIPTNLPPGGTGLVIVQVANVGSVNTDGSKVTVTDQLPTGVEAVEAGEASNSEGVIANLYWECEGVQTVTCTNSPANMPIVGPGLGRNSSGNIQNPNAGGAYSKLEAPEIEIAVRVSASAPDEGANIVHVSGGGGNGAVDDQGVTISSTPAGFGISRFRTYLTNEDGSFAAQAGAHPSKLTVDLSLNADVAERSGEARVVPAADAKDISVEAPAGIVGDPQSAEKCTREEFDGTVLNGEAPLCPLGSEIGEAVIVVGNFAGRGTAPIVLPIYNLVPPPGVPAEFGFASLGIYGTLDASLRTGGDYGITEHIDNTAQRAFFASSVTLWGVPADPSHDGERNCLTEGGRAAHFGCASGSARRPFLTNPTSCGPISPWRAEVTSWQNVAPVSGSSETYDDQDLVQPLVGCERLDFEPSIKVQSQASSADSPSGLSVDVHVPQTYNEPDALASPTVKNVSVALPAGMAISPSAANGLAACTPAQIGISNDQPVACPEAAKVGAVEVSTPLLPDVMHGSVYVAQQNQNPFGSLLAIYITAEGDGALIKLAGHVEANPLTGQLTTTVDNAPPLPFEDFRLELFGGPRAALVSPAACGTYSATSSVTPYSSSTPVSFSEPMTFSSGCGGGFAPSFTSGTVSSQAGVFSPFTLSFSRNDGEQDLRGIEETLPAGLLAKLAGVPRCGEAEVVVGGCPESSRIGSVTVGAGAGSDPYYVQGRIFLTGPYNGGPFGEVVEVPAIAGPFDLDEDGRPVVVRGSIRVNPSTAQATVVSDPFPTILQGIPLEVKTVNVTLDRPGFTFNPTDCSPLSVAGAITSAQGARAAVASPFQATNCATLAFKPGFSASTVGSASKAGGASLDVKVSYPNAPQGSYANIGSVKVDLPKQLPSRLSTLQRACVAATFAANPANCPPESNVGTATAITPVLGAPLMGPAYLVSHAGEAFPSLEIVLQGEGVELVLTGNTQIKKGITSSTFKTVPDAPISSFELKLPTGKYSILGANVPESAHYSLCGQTLAMPTRIVGQNGAVEEQSTKIAIGGCAKIKKLTNAQKLTVALKACRKKARGKRAGCEKAARRRYAPAKRKKGK